VREILEFGPGSTGRVWWHEPHGKLHRWHHHAEPEFSLVCTGSARYLIKDRAYPLAAGDLLFLFPAQEHLLVDLSDDFACWIGVSQTGPLYQAAAGAGYAELRADDPAIDLVRRAEHPDRILVDRLCREVVATSETRAANVLVTATFLTAWRAFVRAPASDATTMHPAVDRAATLLAQDPEDDLESVARRAGLSQSRLSRLFHLQVGETLVAYRTRQRLERFAQLRRAHPQHTLLALALDARLRQLCPVPPRGAALHRRLPRRVERSSLRSRALNPFLTVLSTAFPGGAEKRRPTEGACGAASEYPSLLHSFQRSEMA
jgi:AraC-like DNA-binding protein